MTYRFQLALALLALFLGGSAALAQGPGGPGGGGGMGGSRPPMGNGGGFGGNGGGFPDRRNSSPPPFGGNSPGTMSTMHGGLQVGPPGRWWDDKKFAESIG